MAARLSLHLCGGVTAPALVFAGALGLACRAQNPAYRPGVAAGDAAESPGGSDPAVAAGGTAGGGGGVGAPPGGSGSPPVGGTGGTGVPPMLDGGTPSDGPSVLPPLLDAAVDGRGTSDAGATAEVPQRDAAMPDRPATTPDMAVSAPDLLAPDLAAPPLDAGSPLLTGCPADPDLLACFRFEGQVRDESPLALPVNTTAVAFAPGRDGMALSMTPQTWVSVPATTKLVVRSYTIEAHVMPRTFPGFQERAGVLDDNDQYSLFVYPQNVVRCASGSADLRVSGLLQLGKWSSLACTFENQVLRLWHNGVVRGSMNSSEPLVSTAATAMVIGGNDPGGDAYDPDRFDGLIDNVRVWRRVLTAPQICAAAIGCTPP